MDNQKTAPEWDDDLPPTPDQPSRNIPWADQPRPVPEWKLKPVVFGEKEFSDDEE